MGTNGLGVCSEYCYCNKILLFLRSQTYYGKLWQWVRRWGEASLLGLQSVCGFISWVNPTVWLWCWCGAVSPPHYREGNASHISVYQRTQNLLKPNILQASISLMHLNIKNITLFNGDRVKLKKLQVDRKTLVVSLVHLFTLQMTDWRIVLSAVFMFMALNWISWNLSLHSQCEWWVRVCSVSVARV